MADAPLRLAGVGRTYRTAAGGLTVLQGADLTLAPGEIVALVAPSGTGKSTLLHIAGLLDTPDAGQVLVDGQDAAKLGDAARSRVRGEKIGFIYQFHHLLGEFSGLENVVMPQLIAGATRTAAEARARDLLASLGLADRADHIPGKLSGGEQQRVAIARALANAPKVLLADEPTGNLDTGTAAMVFDLLLQTVRAHNVAALIATHNPDLARRMDRTVTLRAGRIEPA